MNHLTKQSGLSLNFPGASPLGRAKYCSGMMIEQSDHLKRPSIPRPPFSLPFTELRNEKDSPDIRLSPLHKLEPQGRATVQPLRIESQLDSLDSEFGSILREEVEKFREPGLAFDKMKSTIQSRKEKFYQKRQSIRYQQQVDAISSIQGRITRHDVTVNSEFKERKESLQRAQHPSLTQFRFHDLRRKNEEESAYGLNMESEISEQPNKPEIKASFGIRNIKPNEPAYHGVYRAPSRLKLLRELKEKTFQSISKEQDEVMQQTPRGGKYESGCHEMEKFLRDVKLTKQSQLYQSYFNRKKGSIRAAQKLVAASPKAYAPKKKTPSAPVRRNMSRIVFNLGGVSRHNESTERVEPEPKREEQQLGPPIEKSMKPEDAAFFAWLVKRNIVAPQETRFAQSRKTPKSNQLDIRGSVASEKVRPSALTGTIKEFTYLPREYSEQDLVRVNSGKIKKTRKQSATRHKLENSPFSVIPKQKFSLSKKLSSKGGAQDSPASSRKNLGSPQNSRREASRANTKSNLKISGQLEQHLLQQTRTRLSFPSRHESDQKKNRVVGEAEESKARSRSGGLTGKGIHEKKRKLERDRAIQTMLIKQATGLRFSHRAVMKNYLRKMELPQSAKLFVLNSQDHYIKRTMLARGWIPNKVPGSSLFDIRWDFSDNYQYQLLRKGQLYNHFPGGKIITSKTGLSGLLSSVAAVHSSQKKWFP